MSSRKLFTVIFPTAFISICIIVYLYLLITRIGIINATPWDSPEKVANSFIQKLSQGDIEGANALSDSSLLMSINTSDENSLAQAVGLKPECSLAPNSLENTRSVELTSSYLVEVPLKCSSTRETINIYLSKSEMRLVISGDNEDYERILSVRR